MATFCHAMAAQSYALGFLGPHLSSEGTGAGTAVHVNPQGRDGEWGLRVSGRTSHHGAPRLPLGETGNRVQAKSGISSNAAVPRGALQLRPLRPGGGGRGEREGW